MKHPSAPQGGNETQVMMGKRSKAKGAPADPPNPNLARSLLLQSPGLLPGVRRPAPQQRSPENSLAPQSSSRQKRQLAQHLSSNWTGTLVPVCPRGVWESCAELLKVTRSMQWGGQHCSGTEEQAGASQQA